MQVENIKLSSVLCLPRSSLNKIFSCLINLEQRKICSVPLPADWFLLEANFIQLIIITISWSLYTFSIECFNPLSWNLLAKIYPFKSHGFVLFGGWISIDLDAFFSQEVVVYITMLGDTLGVQIIECYFNLCSMSLCLFPFFQRKFLPLLCLLLIIWIYQDFRWNLLHKITGIGIGIPKNKLWFPFTYLVAMVEYNQELEIFSSLL